MLTSHHPTCKNNSGTTATLSALTVLSLLLCGCTTVETESFAVSPASNVQSAQIASNADFSKYDRLHAVDMGIFFPQDAHTPAEDVQRIRQIFRGAFLAELQGYTIVDTPGPGAMTVQATLIDFRNSTSGSLMSLRADLRDVAANGEILFLMEMRDSVTNAVLARAADSAAAPTIATETGVDTDWQSIDDAAQHWASLFRQFLDQNLGKN